LLFGYYPCQVLELVVIPITNSRSSKVDFVGKIDAFFIGGFIGSSFIERSYLPQFCFILLLLYYDVSLHHIVVLVVIFKTISRSLKPSPDTQVMVSAFSRARDSGPKCVFSIFD
jgi:hypothetical protein